MIPANRQIHAKLEIVRPSGRVDVTPYLEAAEVELGSIEDLGTGTGADIGVRTLTFSLRNDGQMVRYWGTEDVLGDSEDILGDSGDVANLGAILGEGKLARNSFAPRDKASGWNLVGGKWEPLLWPYRGAVFQVAVTAPGETPTNWITLFEGYLGDNITTEPHRVTVRCRDKSKRLQDAYIDTPKTYTGPMAAETLIQAIINDYVENPPQLYCPVASGITFDEMKVEYVSVWDAIQNVAKQMGWFLGYRWNGSGFVLTFMEPPRSKNTADFLFNWEDDIYHETLDISDADIRNVVTVVYRDTATGERKTVTVSNPGSIEEYTKRAMQIEEADTSLIDNYSKAYDFAQKCLWDLSELSATDKLDMPLLPELDLFSTFAVTNPLISSTTDFFAVQSVRHSLDFGAQGRFRTEVIATGRVVGARKRWTDMETRPGRPGQPIDPDRIPPGELPPDRLPDYSLGVEKFMENIKPPIVVSSLPTLPDPRYAIGTTVFLTTDKKLYSTDGNSWEPVGAGTVTADEVVAGILTAGGIKADWYAEIRNTMAYVGTDSLDASNPIDVDFYIPSETVNIVSVTLSAKALRYRAYAKTASSGGSHNHDVTIPAHTHVIRTLGFRAEYADTGLGGDHDHGGSTGSTSTDTSYEGDHDHTYYEATGTDSDSHYHSILEMYGETTDYTHSHSITEMQNTTGSNGAHSHTVSHHSHSISVDAGHTHDYLRILEIHATTTEANAVELITSDYSDSHVHDLDYGIALDTTPADVRLYCANGGDFDTGQSLLSAPADPTIEYVLAEELNLTDKFTGSGWKKIRFTSSRRGRITWQLIVKLDITA